MLDCLLAPFLILFSSPTPPAQASIATTAPALAISVESLPEWTTPWPWIQSPAPSSKSSAPEAFIPASSMFLVRCASVDAAVQAIEPFVPATVMEGLSDPLELLKMIAQVDVPIDQVDASRPILISWRLDDPQLPPAATIVVTCKDPDAFTAPLAQAGWWTTTSGKLVACSASEPGPFLAADSPLRAGLDRHDVVLRIAMDEVMDKFGDEVRSTIDAMAQGADEEAGSSKKGVEQLFGNIRDAIESVDMFDLGLALAGGEARATLEMTARDGSSLAGVEKVDAKNLPDVARLIEPDASIACIAALDFSKLWDSFQWAMDAAAEEMPAAERAQFEAGMTTARDLYALVGPTSGVSGSIDEDGVHAFGLMGATDGAAYLAKMSEAMKAAVPWIKLTGPAVSKVDGVDVSTFHFEFDFAAMPEIAKLDDEARQKEVEKSEKGLEAFFGPDGLSVSLASKNGALVFGLGGSGAMHTAFARMASKSPSSTGREMLDLLGKMNPGIVYHIDVAKLMDGVVGLAGRVDPAKSMPRSGELEAMRSFPPLTIAAGVEGRVWRLVLSTDAERMKAMVQRFGDPKVELPMADQVTPRDTAIADIGTIMDALEAYADEHDGKYPDTLAPLTGKDADGEPYLEELPVDPWGRAYLYDPPKDADGDPRVYTLGADGKPGGDGDDEDIDNDSE